METSGDRSLEIAQEQREKVPARLKEVASDEVRYQSQEYTDCLRELGLANSGIRDNGVDTRLSAYRKPVVPKNELADPLLLSYAEGSHSPV